MEKFKPIELPPLLFSLGEGDKIGEGITEVEFLNQLLAYSKKNTDRDVLGIFKGVEVFIPKGKIFTLRELADEYYVNQLKLNDPVEYLEVMRAPIIQELEVNKKERIVLAKKLMLSLPELSFDKFKEILDWLENYIEVVDVFSTEEVQEIYEVFRTKDLLFDEAKIKNPYDYEEMINPKVKRRELISRILDLKKEDVAEKKFIRTLIARFKVELEQETKGKEIL